MTLPAKPGPGSPPAKPAQDKRTSLKKGAMLNWLSLGLNFGVSFVVTPIIIRQLGSIGFGMWALIQSFAGYYGLVNLGLASALQRFVSRDLAKGDLASLQQTVGTAVSFFAGTGLLVLLAALLLRDPAAGFFDIPATDAPAFGMTLLLCATAVVADFFGALLTTLFTARERFDLSNGLSIARQVVQASGILFVLHHSPSINGIAAVVCGVSLVSLLAGRLLAGSLYPDTALTWRGARMARLKELLHYGTSTMLLTISNIVRLRLGNLVIAKTAGLSAVGMFTVASNLVLQMNSIMASSFNVLNPRFTRLHTEEKQAELQALYRLALFVSSSMACGMGLMMLVFGERFILFWIGESFLPAVPLLHVLTIAYVFALAQAPSWNLMFALARHHYMSRVTIIEAGGIVALGLWLSQTHGAIGFAWATSGAMLFTKLFLHPPYAARIAGLRLSTYLAPMGIPFLVAAGLYGLAWLLDLSAILRSSGLTVFLGLAIVLGLSFGGLVFLLSRGRDYAPTSLLKFFGRKKT